MTEDRVNIVEGESVRDHLNKVDNIRGKSSRDYFDGHSHVAATSAMATGTTGAGVAFCARC